MRTDISGRLMSRVNSVLSKPFWLLECLYQNCNSEECTADLVQLQALLPNIVSSIHLLLEGERPGT